MTYERLRERAVLVQIRLNNTETLLSEFQSLAISAGAYLVAEMTAYRKAPDPKYFIGLGKAQELQQTVAATEANLVLFNCPLSPAQQRNLEKLLNCRVLDRTGLILDIFAQRARTFEGKLQVELAQLKHLSTRLVRGWTHLERQKGGIGLRGPGETQLETDRRLIRFRIQKIQARLEKVRAQRAQIRRGRKRSSLPIIALVGYTNAGKSTLFNRLTQAKVYAADQLFATLDPTFRLLPLSQEASVILVDTVGFIQDLPHDLIAAFHATLEEVKEADWLLHVVDAANSHKKEQIKEVNNVLKLIGADTVPQFLIYNKIDLLNQELTKNEASTIWLSAETGEGVEDLLQILEHLVYREFIDFCLVLPPEQGALKARLYRDRWVQAEQIDEQGQSRLILRAREKDLAQVLSTLN